MELQDRECVCLFCLKADGLFMLSNTSINVGSSTIRCQDLIFEIFLAKVDEEVVNFICKRCKELIKEFYIFKQNVKDSLLPSIFDDLKEFLDSGTDKPEPSYKYTENQFIVSFEAEEELELEEIEKIEEDGSSQYIDDEVAMAVEEETEPYYEMQTVAVNEESESAFTDQEYEVPTKTENTKTFPIEYEITEKNYQCDCGAELLTLIELQRHMSQHKRKITTNSKLICCNVSFKDLKCYEIHTKAHENFDAVAPHLQSFACSNCRIMFSNEDDLLTHDAQHEDGNELEETILIDRRSAFDDHMMRLLEKPSENEDEDEDEVELFSCGHCGKKLNELSMKVHLLFFHTHIVFCPHDNRCFEGTKQVRLFSDHIRNKHPEIFDKNNLYTCRHCDKSFATNFEKLAHMKKCDSKLFACENHCNKRFATEWLLKNHLKYIEGENRFSCEVCGKRCVSKSDLQIHCRSHTNERPYSCPICHKNFKTSANRSSHLDIHEPEKRHECETCGEKFQTRPILRKHKKKHDEKYQIECICKICDRRYISKPHLLRHLKASHASPAELTTDKINSFFDEYFEVHGR